MAERQLQAAVLLVLSAELSDHLGGELPASEAFEAVQRNLHDRITTAEYRLASSRPELEAVVFATLCHYRCDAPVDLARGFRSNMREQVAQLQAGVARVRSWAESRYADVVRELVIELRMFTGTNSLLLLFALIGVVRQGAPRTVHTLAALLLAATLVGSYCYLAGQNWLMTLVSKGSLHGLALPAHQRRCQAAHHQRRHGRLGARRAPRRQ
jgi:hypothetical protein